MKLPILLLVLALAATPSSAQFVRGERAVVIRIDDIQDQRNFPSVAAAEYRLLRYQLQNHIPALLSVIAGNFGSDPQLLNLTRTGVKAGLFEIGIHGWQHVSVLNETEAQQTGEMRMAEDKLSSIFGTQIRAFVPPGGWYNLGTVGAMHATGLTLMSANLLLQGVHVGEVAADGIAYFPETVRTSEVNQTTESWMPNPMQSITQQVSNSWASYGVGIAVVHPQQFLNRTLEWSNDKWQSYIQMIDWIRANKGAFVLPEPPRPANQVQNMSLEPFVVLAVLASGIISSLVVAFALRSRRTRNSPGIPRARLMQETRREPSNVGSCRSNNGVDSCFRTLARAWMKSQPISQGGS